jgi:hypothetical protein
VHLHLDHAASGDLVILVDGDPWFDARPVHSPATAEVRAAAVSLDDATALLTLQGRDLRGIAGRGFADVQVGWSLVPRTDALGAAGVRTFGYQYMEFGLPSAGGPDGHGTAPWPLRPAVAMPLLWSAPGGPALLLGPLGSFHEAAIAVPTDEHRRDDVRCGWHGDLDEVEDLESEFVVLVDTDVRTAIDRYGQLVRRRSGTQRGGPAADPAVRGLSYWTDNGAEYYYRTAPERTYPETVADAVSALEADGLCVHAVQLDSWWYPHSTLRGIGEGAEVVPPTGAMTWDPRDDALPGGFAAIRQAVGGRPFVLHSRHLDRSSPYFADGGFAPLADAVDADPDGGAVDSMSGDSFVHPADPDLLDAWMEQAASWGACTYEQDWMVETFLYSAGLRRRAGRADDWLAGMDASAARRGLTLQLCMATPANLLHTSAMTQVSSVRTSMDFRYLGDRQANWGWFLHVNALARALGLATSKDVFVTTGDEHAAVEAMLAAMSCGPVGIGDPIGATDRELVLRTCREDGVLVQPDVPMAAWTPSFLDEPMGPGAPLVGEAWTDHPAGRWHYVAAMAADPGAHGDLAFDVAHLDGPTEACHVARRDRTGEVVGLDGATRSLQLRPGADGLDLWVVAPALAGGRLALFGDVARFAAAGDRRIGRVVERDGTVSFLVLGVPGTTVDVHGWADGPVAARSFVPDDARELPVEPAGDAGTWQAAVEVGPHGWTRTSIRMLTG